MQRQSENRELEKENININQWPNEKITDCLLPNHFYYYCYVSLSILYHYYDSHPCKIACKCYCTLSRINPTMRSRTAYGWLSAGICTAQSGLAKCASQHALGSTLLLINGCDFYLCHLCSNNSCWAYNRRHLGLLKLYLLLFVQGLKLVATRTPNQS